MKLRRSSQQLLGRLLETATSEERVKAIVSSAINLSSLWHQLRGNCLSTDEMFKAMQYKEDLKKYEKDKEEWNKIQKKKMIEDKGRATLLKERFLVDDYKNVLKWKLSDTYSLITKGMKANDLKLLFEQWRDIEVPETHLPLQPQEPPIQAVSHTALGRTIKQKFEEAIAAGGDMLSEVDFIELAKFKVIAQQKGVQLN